MLLFCVCGEIDINWQNLTLHFKIKYADKNLRRGEKRQPSVLNCLMVLSCFVLQYGAHHLRRYGIQFQRLRSSSADCRLSSRTRRTLIF